LATVTGRVKDGGGLAPATGATLVSEIAMPAPPLHVPARQRRWAPAPRGGWRPALAGPGLGALLVLALAGCSAADGPRPMVVGGIGMIIPVGFSSTPGLSAAGEYLIGGFALERGDVRQAAISYRRALAADPDNLELRRRVFILTLASGREEQALAEAEALVEIDPEADEAQLLLGLRDAKAGRFARARERFDGIARAGIVGLALPVLDAWAAAGEGAGEEALALLDPAQRGDLGGTLFAFHHALMLAYLGRTAEANAELELLLPEGEPAPSRMVAARARLLAAGGDVPLARSLLQAEIERKGGDLALEAQLTQLEREPPVLPLPFEPVAGMADALQGLAEALHQQRAGGQAMVYGRLAAFARPDLAEAFILLGDVFMDQGNPEEALRAYGAVAEGHPLGWEARLRTASTLHGKERGEEAFALLRAMAEERPSRTDALIGLGDLLRRDQDYAAAELAYSAAIDRLPTIKREHWPLLYSRGITYERTKRWPEAEADFLRALELEPEQPFVLNYLAYSWVDQGLHLDRALPMLERAVELRPNDGFIVDSLGWVHYRLDNLPLAVEYLERAVELEPGDPILNDHLGDAYWRVGRQREARFQWQRALTLEPEPDAVVEIEAKLRHGLPDLNRAAVPD
jgi:tetratricopeptide (TPR) repeat protein